MKQFFKQVLAVVVGLLLTGAFLSLLSTLMFLAMLSASSTGPTVPAGAVLRLQLKGGLAERTRPNPFATFLGKEELQEQGLDDMVAALRVAAKDKKVKGVYLEAGAMTADFAQLGALRRAICDFRRESHKPVVAYADQYTQAAYYVASAADSLFLNPSGMLDWHGLASTPIFYTDLLEKVGVKMQVFKVGTYKSAVEPYIAQEMSPANREQVSAFLADIWGHVKQDVATSRSLSPARLDTLASRYTAFSDPATYQRDRLCDGLRYQDQVRECLRRISKNKQVRFVEAADLAALYQDKGGAQKSEGKVAVYYCSGEIVDEVAGGFSTEEQIVGSKVVRDLDLLAQDDEVAAVVLRINSGGGSAYASEQMWRAVQLLRAKKPVVVSMSGMAASGGYYLSCGANYIFAEPTTLTGSIGIFGMVPDLSGLMTEKLGLHFDVVKTNEASDFGALGRGFNTGEAAAMQAYVERGYALFLQRVAQGRHTTPAAIDRIAQGRVWTGHQALSLGLVDQLGSLDQAISKAASLAHIKGYDILRLPTPTDPWTSLLAAAVEPDYMESHLRAALGPLYQPLRWCSSLQGRDMLQARLPFSLDIR